MSETSSGQAGRGFGAAPCSTIPGIKAKHAIITPTCRANRGDLGAMEEACNRLLEEYKAIVSARTDEYDCHVVLTVAKRDSSNSDMSEGASQR